MRLLDRYVFREVLVPLSYTLSGFLLFWVTFEAFNNFASLQERHLSFGDIGFYYAMRAPEMLVFVMPVALMLALLYALTNHARHHELTAMRSAGLSLWRICLPYLALGLTFSITVFLLGEYVVPVATARSLSILNKNESAESAASRVHPTVHFRNARDGRIWAIGAFDTITSEMRAVQVEWPGTNGTMNRLFAKRASPTNGAWGFSDVQTFRYKNQTDFESGLQTGRTNYVFMPELAETPEDFRVVMKFNRLSSIDAARKPHLTLQELVYLSTHLDLNQRDRAMLSTQWHARLAQPWMPLVVVLIALPFGAASGRRNVFVGVASSIFICFAYFIVLRFALALGTGGHIPALAAGWLPNLLFGGTGLWLTQRTR